MHNFYKKENTQKCFNIGVSPQGRIGLRTYDGDNIDYSYTWGPTQQRWDWLHVRYTVIDGAGNDRVLVSFKGYEDDPWTDSPEGEIELWHDLSLDQLNTLEASIHPEHTANWSYIDDIRIEGIVADIEENNDNISYDFLLGQNYPNPFNPVTNIRYSLPKASNVVIQIYNSLGQKVAELIDEQKSAGYHSVQFDGSNFASGIYYYRIETGSFVQVKKMLLVR